MLSNREDYGTYDPSRQGSENNLIMGEYGQFSASSSSHAQERALKVEDLPPQMSSKSSKSRSRMSGGGVS